MVQFIVKRDGTLENWNSNKITDSVKKALLSTELIDEIESEQKSKDVTNYVLGTLNGSKQISQEYIQDLVEKSLMKSGYYEAAKNFILYREKRREIREQKSLQFDIMGTIDSYIEGKDWRINENANMDYSYQGLVLNISGEIESKYCLNKYPENIRDAHLSNYFHIHDLAQGLVGYCSGWSLYDLLIEGFNLKDCCSSGPGKHFDSVLSQIINFIGTLQNEWAGAQAFSSIDTLLAPFVYYDGLTYKEVKQSMQRFIYNLNTTSRWGGQCPFSNLSFDLTVPNDYKGKPVLIGGRTLDKTYDEFTNEMDMINKAFLEIMKDGDYNGRIFSFPIPTYNITKEFDWDSEVGQLILQMTAKYGTPYFQNFVSSDIDESQVRSFCLDYNTMVDVQWNNGNKERVKIGYLIDNFTPQEYKIRTPIGYKPIKRHIKKKVDKLVEIETETGSVLRMSEDHPHVVYNNSSDLKVVFAKDLQTGMFVSTYERKNKTEWTDELRKKMSETKKKYYKENPSVIMYGEKNPMYNKTHSDEVKKKISEKSIGKKKPSSFIEFRRRDWSGKQNPVKNQYYWDKKDFNKDNRQISPKEEPIKNFLDQNEYDYTFQKVFYDEKNDKAWVSDFYIHGKNLVVECESGASKCYFNERFPISEHYEKYDFYKELGLDVLVVKPENIKEWTNYLNKKDKIIRVETVYEACYTYDVEILQEEDKKKCHMFYANNILTHNCCRLQLDKRQIKKHLEHKTGGLFGSGELTGSIGVVTLNLPRFAYLSKDKDEFFEILERYAKTAKDALEFKRKMVNNNFDKGMFPWTKRYLPQKYDTYFSTIGVVGGHEACLNLLGEGIDTENGKQFCTDILNKLRDLMIEFQEETGNMYNLEATPAEGTAYKLAKNDKKEFPNIITSGKDEPYYTNSTQLPVDYTDDVFFALEHQDELQQLYTGGTVFHTFVGEEIKDPNVVKDFITKSFTHTKIPYLSVTPTFSICEDHGYLSGEHDSCPHCGKETEVYTRVVGYFRPVKRFNRGKKEEYKERKTFEV